jgi:DNA-directed RNA polymerase specialized sigma24 family protein
LAKVAHNEVIAREQQREIYAALYEFPDAQRRAIVLSYIRHDSRIAC